MLLTIVILSVLLTLAVCGLIACYIIIQISNDKIEKYESWISEFNKNIQFTYNKMREIDDRQIFLKDDEVGIAFSNILSVIEKLKDASK